PTVSALLLTFSILDRGDGLAAQVIYKGKRTAPLQISGHVEEATIRTSSSPSLLGFIRHMGITVGGIVVLLVGGAAILVLAIEVWPRIATRVERHKRLFSVLWTAAIVAFFF